MAELSSEKAIENFCRLVDSFECAVAQIYLVHPYHLFEMDMDDFPTNCYFIINGFVGRNKFVRIDDVELKKRLYEFAKDNPAKVFQGKNQELFDKVFESILKGRGENNG